MIYRLKFVTIRFPQYLKRIYFGHGTYVVFDHNYKRFDWRQSIFPTDFTLYKDDLDCRPLTTQNLAAVGFFACLRWKNVLLESANRYFSTSNLCPSILLSILYCTPYSLHWSKKIVYFSQLNLIKRDKISSWG